VYNRTDAHANAPSDEELIARIRDRGARRDFETLFGRYTGPVYLHCLRILKERDQALDASQEVLTRLFETLDRFDHDRSRFSSWVFTITRRHCLNVVRNNQVRSGAGIVDLDTLISSDEEPDTILESAEEQTRMASMMDEVLDPVEKKALWLRYAEAVSVDEITRLLNVEGASGARGLLQRARRKLRAARSKGTPEDDETSQGDGAKEVLE
jgi:RNA polymerase sigma-70 factor (ECF subfamily)